MFNFGKKFNAKTPVISNEQLQQVLQDFSITTPTANTTLAKLLRKQDIKGTVVTLDLSLPHDANPEQIHQELGQRLHIMGVEEVNLNIAMQPPPTKTTDKLSQPKLPKTTNAMAAHQDTISHKDAGSTPAISTASNAPNVKAPPTQQSLAAHPRITHIVVVASGKGGVGKSTTTVNLALALQKLGNRVGVLDADIYGPSIPTMLGVSGIKPALENEQFVPIDACGMPMLSIGSLLDSDNTPVAWRGPKATGALMQLYNQTNWPHLDYLLIDMPPGTGDIQLTLAQRIPVTGAVIVTTPQHIALLDAQKGIEMFRKVNIPVLGVVENMALHVCSNCGHSEAIFGAGGGEQISEEYHVPLLGQLPLASDIRQNSDNGKPSVIANDGVGDDYAQYYIDIGKNIEANIAKFAREHDSKRIF
ncbi:iron-sulfur cluster carrier protein ApbC [Psychrobacter sp. I-STPA10]|uniref:iron-sulfur cluster carrier protein ApbC n=1 Tax=Psychrobacter sp. I-STPA10 TaxID=2585769 RepID=UPI002E774333|nr:iron-sulfur cluster carrier protein ApbC [Psychrobacter sp. I-STPA10]